MKVLVITQIAENERDLEIVMVTRAATLGMVRIPATVSKIVTIERAASCRRGNPYLVYGDAVAKFVSVDALDCDITVAECVSGNLDGWR